MPVITRVTLKCDICGHESKPEEGRTPKRWIQFTKEKEWEERAWDEIAICAVCLTLIHAAEERAAVAAKINKP